MHVAEPDHAKLWRVVLRHLAGDRGQINAGGLQGHEIGARCGDHARLVQTQQLHIDDGRMPHDGAVIGAERQFERVTWAPTGRKASLKIRLPGPNGVPFRTGIDLGEKRLLESEVSSLYLHSKKHDNTRGYSCQVGSLARAMCRGEGGA